jgi:hypothetical protein
VASVAAVGAPSVRVQPKEHSVQTVVDHGWGIYDRDKDLFEQLGISREIAEPYFETGFAEENAARLAYLDVHWHIRDPSHGGWGDHGYITARLDMVLDAVCFTRDDLDSLGAYLQSLQRSGVKLIDAATALMDLTRNPRGVTMFEIAEVEWQRDSDLPNADIRTDPYALINLIASSPYKDEYKTTHAALWLDSTHGNVVETGKLRHAVPRATPDIARSAPTKSSGLLEFNEIIVRSEIAFLATGGGDDETREAIAKIASMELDFQPLTKEKKVRTSDDFAGMDDDLVALAAEAYKIGRLEAFMGLAADRAPRPQLEAFVAEDMAPALSDGAL